MSTYTAPQRPNRKRILSRRAQILIFASLLVPTSLLAIAKAPVHAATNSNPIYATIQDVQNAINTALAPIQSAIANLQQQQQTQASQISSLQGTSSKALHVYDANGQDLGILMDHAGAGSAVYSTSLQRLMYLYLNPSAIDGTFSGWSTGSAAYYQSTDCTGTPYTLSLFANPDGWTGDLLPVGPHAYYIIPDNALTTTVSINSNLHWDTTTNQALCSFYSLPNTQAYQLQAVNLPFTLPLALPLHYKYQ